MGNLVHMIIYDRSNYDSLICAAMQKYHILETNVGDEVVAYNWDEIPYTINTHVNTIKAQCKSISLCAALVDIGTVRVMFNALRDSFLSIQFNPVYKDLIANINSNINQLFSERPEYSHLAESAILAVGQSASLTLYKYLHKNQPDITIPRFYKYLDGFITDTYYEGQILRDDVMKFEKGLVIKFRNDFDNVYAFIENQQTIEISDNEVTPIINIGESEFVSTQNYIIDNFKKYGGVTWQGDNKSGIVRKVLPIWTCEKLSESILIGSDLFDQYDSIVTFNKLKNGYWEMCMYTILHIVEDSNNDGVEDLNYDNLTEEDFENMPIEQLRKLKLNLFSAGIYMKNQYGGFGNDIYGYALISDARMCQILSIKQV